MANVLFLTERENAATRSRGPEDDFLIQGFHIRNYTGNGVVNNRASGVTYRDLIVENSGLYAIYPVECNAFWLKVAS